MPDKNIQLKTLDKETLLYPKTKKDLVIGLDESLASKQDALPLASSAGQVLTATDIEGHLDWKNATDIEAGEGISVMKEDNVYTISATGGEVPTHLPQTSLTEKNSIVPNQWSLADKGVSNSYDVTVSSSSAFLGYCEEEDITQLTGWKVSIRKPNEQSGTTYVQGDTTHGITVSTVSDGLQLQLNDSGVQFAIIKFYTMNYGISLMSAPSGTYQYISISNTVIRYPKAQLYFGSDGGKDFDIVISVNDEPSENIRVGVVHKNWLILYRNSIPTEPIVYTAIASYINKPSQAVLVNTAEPTSLPQTTGALKSGSLPTSSEWIPFAPNYLFSSPTSLRGGGYAYSIIDYKIGHTDDGQYSSHANIQVDDKIAYYYETISRGGVLYALYRVSIDWNYYYFCIRSNGDIYRTRHNDDDNVRSVSKISNSVANKYIYQITDNEIVANSDITFEITDDTSKNLGLSSRAVGSFTLIRDSVPTSAIPYTYKVKQTSASGQFTLINHFVPEQMQSNWNETDTSSKAYIQNKPSIPTVNNGKLTIQKNGNTVAEFSANDSNNVTANIDLSENELITNKITNITGGSSNTQYPSAQAVYDFVANILGGEINLVIDTAGTYTLSIYKEDTELTEIYINNVLSTTSTTLGSQDISITTNTANDVVKIKNRGKWYFDDYCLKSGTTNKNANISAITSIFEPTMSNIGINAFSGATGLSNITIPGRVRSIKSSAFSKCSNVANLILSDSIKNIWEGAFNGKNDTEYMKITSLNIPSSVINIKASAFYGLPKLATITVDLNNTSYYSEGNCLIETAAGKLLLGCKNSIIPTDGRVMSIENYAFAYNNELTSIVIPESVTKIGAQAFYQCSSLTSITIPNSVTSIGSSAFSGCSGLESITIPDSVTSIGNWAFNGCRGLTSVTIGNGVTSIGDEAFEVCASLTNITIPDSVTSIGSNAFSGCNSLTYNEYDNAYYLGNATNPYVVLVKAKNTSITTCDIHANTKVIYSGAFAYCSSLTSVTIPDSVTSIGSRAFYNCSGLTSVTIGDSVTSIGNYAFSFCSNLTNITIPDSVTSIGSDAFYNCISLTSITIRDGIISIGERAFYNCSSLTYNEYDNAYYLGNDTNPYVVLVEAKNTSITTCDIYANTKVIYDGAFRNCSSLTSITIPDSVTSIGSQAFYNCSELTMVNWNAINCISTGSSSFGNCMKLTTINIGNNVETLPPYIFYGCSKLTSITIPDSVTSIGERTFYNCSGLTNITIGNSLISIGNYAFNNCSRLKSITIPDSITHIGSYAFEDCSELTEVIIGNNNNVNIGYYAFKNVGKSTYASYKTTYRFNSTLPPILGLDVFTKETTRKIQVPTISLEQYKTTNLWDEYADLIVGI